MQAAKGMKAGDWRDGRQKCSWELIILMRGERDYLDGNVASYKDIGIFVGYGVVEFWNDIFVKCFFKEII